MKKLLMLALCALLALSVCVPATAEEGQAVYRSLYSGEITSLNYLTTSTTNEFTIAANVIDTLIERDPFGGYVPCLAESWETSEDGLTWTFHLRKDAKWLTYEGKVYADVTANDFITSAKYILDAANASSTSWILTDYILNAKAYYYYTDGEGEEISFDEVGIKAIDDYTIAYTTAEPCPYFLSMLDYVCYMPVNAQFLEEKGADFGLATGPDTLLYCGPYILSEFAPQEKRVYTKNAMNWDAEHVYIDVIQQTYNKEAGTLSPELYLRGEVDDADITSTIAAEWLADPEKADLIHPVRQYWQYSYFWTFNFDAQFEADYEPENPEDLLSDTIMPRDICVLDGVDYTTMGALENIAFDMDNGEGFVCLSKESVCDYSINLRTSDGRWQFFAEDGRLILQRIPDPVCQVGHNGDAVGQRGQQMHQHHTRRGIRKSEPQQCHLDAHGKHGSRDQQRQKSTEADQGLAPELIELRCPCREQANRRTEHSYAGREGDAAAQKARQFCRAGQEFPNRPQAELLREQLRPGPARRDTPEQQEQQWDCNHRRAQPKERPKNRMLLLHTAPPVLRSSARITIQYRTAIPSESSRITMFIAMA